MESGTSDKTVVATLPDSVLAIYPQTITHITPDCNLVIGDLQANAHYLVNILIRVGILKLDEASYTELSHIYNELEKLTPDEVYERSSSAYKHPENVRQAGLVKLYQTILQNKGTFQNNVKHIYFMGDTIGDRARYENLVIFILEKLSEKNIDYGISTSNHDHNSIYNYLNNFRTRLEIPQRNRASKRKKKKYGANKYFYFKTTLYANPNYSLLDIYNLLAAGHILKSAEFSPEVLAEKYKKFHFNKLKWIDYSYDAEKDALVIDMHAGNGMKTLRNMASNLDLPFDESSCPALAASLDLINERIAEFPEHDRFYYLATLEMDLVDQKYDDMPFSAPFTRLMWTRGLKTHKDEPKKFQEDLTYDMNNRKLKVIFKHGHNGYANTEFTQEKNYDSNIGRFTMEVEASLHDEMDFEFTFEINKEVTSREYANRDDYKENKKKLAEKVKSYDYEKLANALSSVIKQIQKTYLEKEHVFYHWFSLFPPLNAGNMKMLTDYLLNYAKIKKLSPEASDRAVSLIFVNGLINMIESQFYDRIKEIVDKNQDDPNAFREKMQKPNDFHFLKLLGRLLKDIYKLCPERTNHSILERIYQIPPTDYDPKTRLINWISAAELNPTKLSKAEHR